VYLLALRHPMIAARQIASLAETAPGRLTVGVGVGGEDRHEFEVCEVDPTSRGRRTDVALALVRSLLDGDTVDGDGAFFDFTGGVIRPTPQNSVCRSWSVGAATPPFDAPVASATAGSARGARRPGSRRPPRWRRRSGVPA
jgi:alkanesulfonate monooxygenase SsuD/methylene tetrahydromethanopterin reductase-like flavin-dependent oxidoreductase (luciferase family)